jgi:phthalate 4,5-cis-dihydrodiol dehydrogenase
VNAAERAAHEHFGPVIVCCERADLRPLPDGVIIYDASGARLDPLPPPAVPRREVIDELHAAIADGVPPLHDGRWARATLEACGALLESARSGHDVALAHQVAVPARARD